MCYEWNVIVVKTTVSVPEIVAAQWYWTCTRVIAAWNHDWYCSVHPAGCDMWWHCCSSLSEVWVDMQCMAINNLSPESNSCSYLQKTRTVGITLHATCTVHWLVNQMLKAVSFYWPQRQCNVQNNSVIFQHSLHAVPQASWFHWWGNLGCFQICVGTTSFTYSSPPNRQPHDACLTFILRHLI